MQYAKLDRRALRTQNGRHRNAAGGRNRGSKRRRGEELTAAKFPLVRHDHSLLVHNCWAGPIGMVWLFKVLELGSTILRTLDKAATVNDDPI